MSSSVNPSSDRKSMDVKLKGLGGWWMGDCWSELLFHFDTRFK